MSRRATASRRSSPANQASTSSRVSPAAGSACATGTGAVTRRWNRSSSAASDGASRRVTRNLLELDGAGAPGFLDQTSQGRDGVVPLDQRRHRPGPAQQSPVELPDLAGDRVVVAVEEVAAAVLMARQVDLADLLGRDAVDEARRVEAEVAAADVG